MSAIEDKTFLSTDVGSRYLDPGKHTFMVVLHSEMPFDLCIDSNMLSAGGCLVNGTEYPLYAGSVVKAPNIRVYADQWRQAQGKYSLEVALKTDLPLWGGRLPYELTFSTRESMDAAMALERVSVAVCLTFGLLLGMLALILYQTRKTEGYTLPFAFACVFLVLKGLVRLAGIYIVMDQTATYIAGGLLAVFSGGLQYFSLRSVAVIYESYSRRLDYGARTCIGALTLLRVALARWEEASLAVFFLIMATTVVIMLFALSRAVLSRRHGVIVLVAGMAFYGGFAAFCQLSSQGLTGLSHVITGRGFEDLGVCVYLLAIALLVIRMFASNFNYAVMEGAIALQSRELLEERVLEQTLDLERSNSEVRAAYEQLKASRTSKQNLIIGISHDIRTPLSIIGGYVSMLVDPGLEAEKRESYRERIEDRLRYTSSLLEDLLLLSKLDSQDTQPAVEDVDAAQLLELLAAHLGMTAERAGIGLSLDIQATPLVRANHIWLSRAVENVVVNGIKCLKPGDKVRVSLKTQGEKALITVADNGPGIQSQDLPYLFDRYYKGKTKQASPATSHGLGLNITKEIINLYGGSVEVQSQYGHGAVFTLTLPKVREDE